MLMRCASRYDFEQFATCRGPQAAARGGAAVDLERFPELKTVFAPPFVLYTQGPVGRNRSSNEGVRCVDRPFLRILPPPASPLAWERPKA